MSRVIRVILIAFVFIMVWAIFMGLYKSCSDRKAMNDSEDVVEVTLDGTNDGVDNASDEFEAVDTDDDGSTAGDDLFDDDDLLKDALYPPASDAPTPKEAAAVKKETKPSSPAPKSTTVSSSGKYMVVAGNYLVKDNALRMVQKLKKMGHTSAEYVVFDLSQYYTVSAGRSGDYNRANSLSQELRRGGIDSYVHTIQN